MRTKHVTSVLGPSDVVRLFVGTTVHNCRRSTYRMTQETVRRIHFQKHYCIYRGDACSTVTRSRPRVRMARVRRDTVTSGPPNPLYSDPDLTLSDKGIILSNP